MKKKNTKLVIVFLIIFIIQYKLKSQNQSMLLPVPSESSSVINFINPLSPEISILPMWDSYRYGNPLQHIDPHSEEDLEIAIPSMNEKYLGQHPMFAQNIVHDKDGNLLFFIVDNNIYNKNEEE